MHGIQCATIDNTLSIKLAEYRRGLAHTYLFKHAYESGFGPGTIFVFNIYERFSTAHQISSKQYICR